MSLKISHKEISVVGGAGHVGFPLGLVFASKNFKVNLIDYNENFLNMIKKKKDTNNHLCLFIEVVVLILLFIT